MAHTIYENFVLENKLENLLTTAVDLNSYLTVDNSLTATPGMKKTIHKYTATGNVQDLAMGTGNSSEITVSFSEEEYEVKVTQGKFSYYDEQEMTDPMVVDMGMRAISQKMTNDLTAKAIAEFGKATLAITYTKGGSPNFDTIVDAIAKLNTEDESGFFLMTTPGMQASLRKALGDNLKYSESFARTGYIGTVCGVPVTISKAVPDKTLYLATREAVTCFVKKGSEIEQERDADKRQNFVFGRKVMLVALTDATKIVKITEATA